jgi:hypothetical protein
MEVSIGTDSEIFGYDEPDRIQVNGSAGGRPQINRNLARRLFQAGFKPSQVAKSLKCHVNTARTIRRELEAERLLAKEDRDPGLSIVQADFDEECRMAVGISFADWLKTKMKIHKRVFTFCRRTWDVLWDKPSLVLTKDSAYKLGDQLCMKFLEAFGKDVKRIRYRKKLIRTLFRFLGRHDLCDRYLTMTESRDPRYIRRIPQIEMREFPSQVQSMLDEINAIDSQIGLATEFKIASQMRTGDRSEGRGLMGIRVGAGHPSYIIMNGPDEFRCHVLEKMRKGWDITWLPRRVRERLWELYQQREVGDYLFSFSARPRVLRELVKECSLRHIGVEMVPHDMRKISITWLFVMGVPLELAVMINVGWKDLNTPKDHYLHMRGLLKNSDRKAYRDNIPEWFKDGLDEYRA